MSSIRMAACVVIYALTAAVMAAYLCSYADEKPRSPQGYSANPY